MAEISSTRDDGSCDQTQNAPAASAWKSFVGKMAGRFPTAMSQMLRGRGQLRGASVSQLQASQFRGVLRGRVQTLKTALKCDVEEGTDGGAPELSQPRPFQAGGDP